MEFTGSYTIGQKEVTRFTRRIQWDQKRVTCLILSAMGLLGGNFLVRCVVETPGFWIQVVGSLAGGMVAFAICYGGLRYSIAKDCNSEYAAGRRWTYTQTLTINPLGVTCVTDEGKESHADFEELVVEECPEAFYIFVSKESAWIIPKDQLKQPEEDAAKIRQIFTTMAEPRRLNLLKVKG